MINDNTEANSETTEFRTIIILRLQWRSRFFDSLVSAAFLHDYLVGQAVPATGSTLTIRLFDRHSVHVDVVCTNIKTPFEMAKIFSTSSSSSVQCNADTTVHLIPPLPPWLMLKSSPSSTRTWKLSNLISHSLKRQRQKTPIFNECENNRNLKEGENTVLPIPRIFFLQGPHESGKTSCVLHAAHSARTTIVRATPSYLLPRMSVPTKGKQIHEGVIHMLVQATIDAATCMSETGDNSGAILFLDDIHFLLGVDAHDVACALISAVDLLQCARVPVVLVMTSLSTKNLHRSIYNIADIHVSGSGGSSISSDSDSDRDSIRGDSSSEMTMTELENMMANAHINLQEKMDKEEEKLKWDSISKELPGTENAVRILKRIMLGRHGNGVIAPRAALLYGVPGTGKTAVVRAAACVAGYTIYSVDAAKLAHGAVGESEERLSKAFQTAISTASSTSRRSGGGVVLLFDELDTLLNVGAGSHATRLVARFAQCLDDLQKEEYSNKKVSVVAATNRPWAIPKTLRRPGRIDYCVHVGVPESKERGEIAAVYARRMNLSENVTKTFVRAAEEHVGAMGMTGADVVGVVRNAAMKALWRGKSVTERDVTEAFDSSVRSVSTNEGTRIDRWNND